MPLIVLEQTPSMVKVLDVEEGRNEEYWIPKEKYNKKVEAIRLVEQKEQQKQKQRAERLSFLFECYMYLLETGPQKNLFGSPGKRGQAEYRERNALSPLDPIMSNLSSWGKDLQDMGYIRKRKDGFWEVTEKQWVE